ncbi:MAG: crotonyl-CoA carboxylase/reductase, partial [Alphaproteobacteria bacterium]|nr:crotonyl-CoA carboxylase/reductase [Alphaproteobacteria bacterium]
MAAPSAQQSAPQAVEETAELHPGQEYKDLYEVGEIPPLGHVPSKMYAWAIRRERHGPPEQAMQKEVVDTPEIDPDEVLVL